MSKTNAKGFFKSGAALLGASMLLFTLGCSSGPSQTAESFVKLFLAKHIQMLDTSVSTFYVAEEQAGIKEKVNKHVTQLKEQGLFDAQNSTKYDFSNVQVKVVEEKEIYVDDAPAKFVQVSVTGTYKQTQGDKTSTLNEDETIILAAVGNEWKVTEKTNPWN